MVGAYSIVYFVLLVVFGAYFVVRQGTVAPERRPLKVGIGERVCGSAATMLLFTPYIPPGPASSHAASRKLNLFLAVLKTKFAKAQSLLIDRQAARQSRAGAACLTAWQLHAVATDWRLCRNHIQQAQAGSGDRAAQLHCQGHQLAEEEVGAGGKGGCSHGLDDRNMCPVARDQGC